MQKIIEDRNKLLSVLTSVRSSYPYLNYDLSFFNEIIFDKNEHLVSLSQDDHTKISYAKSKEDKFDSEKRIKTTFERYVRRQLNIESVIVGDDFLNDVGRQVRNTLTPLEYLDSKIKILTGKDIMEFYQFSSIKSCMCWKDSFKTELYTLNPDIISLVVFDDSKARALLWTHSSGDKILDRIYPNNTDAASMLKSWANRKGYVYRVSNGLVTNETVQLSNSKIYEFELCHNNIFPYFDTFCYGHLENPHYLLLTNVKKEGNIFHSSHGGYDDLEVCFNCHTMLRANEIKLDRQDYPYCADCFTKLYSTCCHCEGVYPFTPENDCDNYIVKTIDRHYCESCFSDIFAVCTICKNTCRQYNMIYHHMTDEYSCKNCIKEI
jgi:hypothetical protein